MKIPVWYIPSSVYPRELAAIVCLSVRLSLTSWCYTETAKCKIMPAMPHDSPGTRFLVSKTQTGSPPMEAPDAGVLGKVCLRAPPT